MDSGERTPPGARSPQSVSPPLSPSRTWAYSPLRADQVSFVIDDEIQAQKQGERKAFECPIFFFSLLSHLDLNNLNLEKKTPH